MDGLIASKKLLGTFDVSRVATEAPLFQTGYLTMVGQAQHDGIKHYCLDYPTREVSERFNLSLLDCLTGDESRWESYRTSLSQLLKAADYAGLETVPRPLRPDSVRVAQPQRDRAL